MGKLSSLKVSAQAVCDLLLSLAGRVPLMVATAGPPGSAALMAVPDAQAG